MRKLSLLFFFIVTLIAVAEGQNSTETYNVGGRQIRIPPPDEYLNVSPRFARIEARLRASQTANEFIAAFVPGSIFPDLTASQDIDLKGYALAVVSPRVKSTDLTPQMFKAVVAEIEKNFGTYLDPNGAAMKRAAKNSGTKLSEFWGTDINLSVSGVKNLGFFQKTNNAFSGMMLASVKVFDREIENLGTFSIVNVNKRLIFVYAFQNSPVGEDVAKLQTLTKNWTAKIIAANGK